MVDIFAIILMIFGNGFFLQKMIRCRKKILLSLDKHHPVSYVRSVLSGHHELRQQQTRRSRQFEERYLRNGHVFGDSSYSTTYMSVSQGADVMPFLGTVSCCMTT